MIGIYQIKNKITSKLYIGSSKNIEKRWKEHKYLLNKNKHHSMILQRAWNKYIETDFIFEIIEILDNIDNLQIREQFYLDTLLPVYNISDSAFRPPIQKHSQEHKTKMSILCKLKGQRPPPPITKSVNMLDKQTGEFIKSFNMIKDACSYLNRPPNFSNSISQVCDGRRKSLLGYKWEWNKNK
jgi:hypothetical protein